MDPTRFQGPRSRHPGDWASPPSRWDLPDERMVGRETLLVIKDAIDRLTPSQRTVITLRDVEGWSSKDVCNVLDITETNQRVLLHRARSSVRAALERYLDPVERDNAGGPGR